MRPANLLNVCPLLYARAEAKLGTFATEFEFTLLGRVAHLQQRFLVFQRFVARQVGVRSASIFRRSPPPEAPVVVYVPIVRKL